MKEKMRVPPRTIKPVMLQFVRVYTNRLLFPYIFNQKLYETDKRTQYSNSAVIACLLQLTSAQNSVPGG